jgi:hypothetical protein
MDFKELVKIKAKRIEEETIIHYPEVRALCYRAYPGHKNGITRPQIILFNFVFKALI